MRSALIFAALLFLGACAYIPGWAGLEGVSAATTKKTFTDHLVSVSSGKNCSTVRVNRGQSYCEEDEINPRPKVFCYRTIGSVSCYDRPDPYGRQQVVGGNDHNRPTERLIPEPRRGFFDSLPFDGYPGEDKYNLPEYSPGG